MTRFTKIISIILAASFVVSVLTLISNTYASADNAYTLSGTAHVQDIGDCEGSWDESTGILTLGTRGQGRRVEAIAIDLENNTGLSGTLQYRVHIQNYGWQDYRSSGEKAGTSGQALRLEGIEMFLTGELSTQYSVEYRVHIQDYGDAQGWVSDGALAGTTGESKRLEEVQIRLVPMNSGSSTTVNYRVHRQDYGWESVWKTNGQSSGTIGESKRLEGIEIHLSGNEYPGGIQYKTHVQNIGWENSWSKNGEMSGTQGMSYRLEAIQIELTGEIAEQYDVYYRVHAQDYGWLGWAKNGEISGTSGLSKRLEAIQILLVRKGGNAPGSVEGISSITSAIAISPDGYVYPATNNNSSTGNDITTSIPASDPIVITSTPTPDVTDAPVPGSDLTEDTTIPLPTVSSTPIPTEQTPIVTATPMVTASPAPTAAVNPTTVECSCDVVSTCAGIDFALAKAYVPYYGRTYLDQGINLSNNSNGARYCQAQCGIYVSSDIDINDVYVKYNGSEGFKLLSNVTQYFPDLTSPVATAKISYSDDLADVRYFGDYCYARRDYMREKGFEGCISLKICCTCSGIQCFDVYYKNTKVTTLSIDCSNAHGTLPSPLSDTQAIYDDIIRYKANMNDLELMSAGCYWISNHSYSDYSCLGCHLVASMMMEKGYPVVVLACSQVVNGQLVNDYGNYYAANGRQSDPASGHQICLVFINSEQYAYIETAGSASIPKGETDFSTPWIPKEIELYSVYDYAWWLRDYDTVYDMVIGEYGVDLKTFDPCDSSTWYD